MGLPLQPYLSPQTWAIGGTGPEAIAPAIRLNRAPTGQDRNFVVGSVWSDTSSYDAYILAGFLNGVAQWVQVGTSPSGNLDQLTGNSGGAVLPTGSNINVVAAANTGLNVLGVPGSSSLVIQNRNSYIEGTATTVDGTTFVPILTLAVPANNSLIFDGRLVAYSAAGGAASSLVKLSSYAPEGVASPIGTSDVILDKAGNLGPDDSSTAVQVSFAASNAILSVRGAAGVTASWFIQGFYTVVGA